MRHASFGEGLVLEVAARGDDLMLRVSFPPPAGERRLLARIAQLEHVETPPGKPPR